MYGVNTTATTHEANSAMATTQKMPPHIHPLRNWQSRWEENRPPSRGSPLTSEVVDSQANDAARMRSKPCSIFTTIISTAMMASSTRRPSAIISAPSVIRCKSRPMASMTMNTTASTSGTDSATTAGAPAERQKAYEQHDRQRFDEGMDELVDSMVDDDRLIGDLLEIEALWNRGLEIGGRARYRRTELKDIGALRHDDADADRCFAFLPDQKIRRGRDNRASPWRCRRRGTSGHWLPPASRNCFGAVQRSGYAQRHALRRRLQHAGRHDRILANDWNN